MLHEEGMVPHGQEHKKSTFPKENLDKLPGYDIIEFDVREAYNIPLLAGGCSYSSLRKRNGKVEFAHFLQRRNRVYPSTYFEVK